ncbi:hypothetical protein Tco_0989866 [Tanacetum coccineum]|uniref:Retrovirus-related Pol polyprotein from transposon TNT 1-94-like beta-barrel domain-containing protein n=1 Tax=Tanacetum coccineum TaxID=301880 RepID=A0ABQ5EV97_9ASTR
MYDLLLRECVSKGVKCSYLHSLSNVDAHTELQCMYLYKVKECDCLAEKLSKQTKTDICKGLKRQEQLSPAFKKEHEYYHEMQGLKAKLQDKDIALIEDSKPSILGRLTPFSYSLERNSFSNTESVPKTNVPEGVIHRTSVSRPQLKSTQMKDKVVHNNSQVKFKKTEVEDHLCADCGKCVFDSDHFACVSKFLNDVNARSKKPKSVPTRIRKLKNPADKSVATLHKKIVASYPTIQKYKSYFRMLYKNTNKTWKWWIEQKCLSGYELIPKPKMKWVPKVRKDDVNTSLSPTIDNASRITNIAQIILFIVDSGCTKHMTGNLMLLCNFVEKFLGTVHFRNDQFAPILGYGDLVQGNITIKRVYYVEGLNHNLFSIGQLCDVDLEVAFQNSTCFIRDLQGNDLLTRNCGSDLYTISFQETTSATSLYLMAKALPT